MVRKTSGKAQPKIEKLPEIVTTDLRLLVQGASGILLLYRQSGETSELSLGTVDDAIRKARKAGKTVWVIVG